MAYVPNSGSVVAFQSQPSSLLVGASVIGLTPVNVTNLSISPSVIAYQAPGSILAVSGSFTSGNTSVTAFQGGAWTVSVVGNMNSSVTAFQSGTWTTSVVNTTPSSMMVGASIFGTVPVTQVTSPWIINQPSPSIIAYQLAGSILAVSATVNTGNSSVQLLGGIATIGSVVGIQGTNPYIVTGSVQGVMSVLGTVPVTQSTTPWIIGSILGTYQEKNAVTPSAIGIPILYKIDETNSVLSAVSPQNPLPVKGSVMVLQGTNPWQVNLSSPSILIITPGGSVQAVRTDNASVIAVLSNSSVTALQGTNPWQVNVPTSSYISYQLAGSVLAVSGSFSGGNSSVTLLGGGTVYQERAAAGIASALGIPFLFKASDTTSVLSTISPANPLPVSVFGTVLTTNPNSSVMLTASTNHSVLTAQMYGYSSVMLMASTSSSVLTATSYGFSSVMLMASTNSSVAVLASQNTNPWVIGSIVGTYQEDQAATTSDKGLFVLHVRNDTMSSVTNADLDYSALSVGPVGEMLVANAPITKWFSTTASVMYGTSVQVLAAPGTSIFSYITGIHVMNESANFSRVTFTQGLGAVASSILTRVAAPATGGSNSNYINPIRVLDNNGISASISGVSSVLITLTGFNSKV